ncbi:unnamed protein product [Nippostrongylus brasiliensis]|uniref:SCP domain-containing protein n=1 Tax=Nippostrongylus brasiliensis TaxID=27835 RepID=A0A0N4XJT7_NIPBR|nr:unnamed protein product [Nippostrongylus brasiliensis]
MDANATYTSSLNNFAQEGNFTHGLIAIRFRPQLGEPLYPVTSNPVPGTGCGGTPTSCPEVDGKPSNCNANLCEAPQDATFAPANRLLESIADKEITRAKPIELEESISQSRTFSKRGNYHSSNHSCNDYNHHSVYDSCNHHDDSGTFNYRNHYNHRCYYNYNSNNYNNCCWSGHEGYTGYDCLNAQQSQRYDQLLGADAQAYAESCPTSTAATINNYAYGQNVLIANTVSIAYSDLFESAIRNWFDEIYINGMNNKMNFTEFLATKPNPPTHFTQVVGENDCFPSQAVD